jgi:hypothetical protein
VTHLSTIKDDRFVGPDAHDLTNRRRLSTSLILQELLMLALRWWATLQTRRSMARIHQRSR